MLRAFASTARRARVVRVFQEVTGTVTHETTPGHIMSNRAWVTLATNDSYGLGALVLAHSLRRVNSVYPTVVLITPSVTEAMRNRLSAVFAEVITVDVLDSRDAAHLALLQRPELGITFTKIHCWTLTQYEKCVFLDADTLIVQNCDELFEREELSAAPDVGWPDCFNSGVFVFVPSNETYSRLITFAKERGSFDGGDQGLLNAFFSDWARGDINKHLPFLYNVTSAAFYSYLPALKHYGQDLKIIHFIGNAKPWLQSFNWESRSVDAPEHLQQFLQQWWDVFVGQVHPQLDTAMGLAVEVEEALPETTPPEVPPEDVQHHYEPEIDPESEFPWHRPEAQNQQTENKPEQVDLSQIHDPWQHYRGNIPKTDYSYNQQTDFGVKQFEEELKKMAWEYQYPHQDLNRMPSSQEQIEHNIWQPPQQQHEYTQHSNHQEHIHQQVHYQHHEHHWEPHEYHHEQQHSYDHHQHSNDDHGWHYQEQHSHHSDFEKQHDHTVQSHHQHFHDHSTHTPHHVSSDHSDQHFNESHRHDNQSEIRPDRVTVQDNDYRVPEPHVISNDHSRKHSKHRSYHQHLGNKQFSPYTTQPRIEQVYHMHLDHRQNRRQCKVNNAHYSGMNGDASDSESEDEEYIVPRHPYDGFYLRHRATIDSRGHKICSHEIPPTPTPSPPPPEESRDVLSPTRSEEEFDTASECEEQYSGVAGNLARVVPGASNYQRDAIDELTRRQGWEAGNIDYMGADSFDNIWAKISQTLNQPRQSPPKQSPQKEPTPPKEPIPPKEQPQEAPAAQESPAPVEAAPVETPVAVAPVQPVPAETPAQAAPVAAPVPASSAPAAPTPETPKAEAPAAAPTQQAAKPAEVPKPVQEAVQVVAAATPQTKTEPAVPPTPPVTPKSTPEATTPVTETPVETQAAATPVETSKAAPASPAPAAEAPAVTPPKVQATPEKSESAALTTASTDSPPLAHTPSKEEVPAVPAAKSEERRKPAEKLQLRPPAPVADALPTPDSELEDAAALAQSIIAGELSVTAPSPSADPASPPPAPEAKKLSVEAPELPTPPVSLAQIGVKPKGKPTTAAQIESSVTEKAPPPEPSSPTEAPKKKVVKKGAKKEGGVGDAATPVPPPRKKEKKPKEK